MPRKYIRKHKTAYSDASFQLALKKLDEGISIAAAAKEFSIPYETLRRWVMKKPAYKGSSGQTALTREEENLIVEALKFTSKCGFPMDRKDLVAMVETYFTSSSGRPNPFNNNCPGIDWVRGFEKRWSSELCKRKPELLTKSRADSLSQSVVSKFFDMYEKILLDHNLMDKPDRIYNLDEVGLGTDSRHSSVFVPKSARTAYLKSASAGKTNYSVLFCISAAGEYLPPFTVYKGLHLYNTWTKGGPDGALYGCTVSGWMQDTVFETWFQHFAKHVESKEKPILLIFDGHGSHLTYKTVRHAITNEVIILCLPPHTSHALQPLDVGVFAPLKKVWRHILKLFYRESRLRAVDKSVFPSLLKQLFENVSQTNAVKGFKGSGIFPVNRTAVQHRIVLTEVLPNTSEINEASTSVSSIAEPVTSLTAAASMLDSPNRSKSSNSTNLETPFKDLKRAILTTLSPTPSSSTIKALQNSRCKRKRVQAKAGEILTTEEVAERMLIEENQRFEKKSTTAKPRSTLMGKKQMPKKKQCVKNTLCETISHNTIDRNTSNRPIVSGCWVKVKYEGRKSVSYYIGQVINIVGPSLCNVKFLTKSRIGTVYVFPENEDIDTIDFTSIVQVLNEPTFDNRGHYCFQM